MLDRHEPPRVSAWVSEDDGEQYVTIEGGEVAAMTPAEAASLARAIVQLLLREVGAGVDVFG